LSGKLWICFRRYAFSSLNCSSSLSLWKLLRKETSLSLFIIKIFKIASALLKKVPKGVHNILVDFITRLYAVYVDCQFTYLEINPLVVVPRENADSDAQAADVYFLDLAAKLDQTAEFECGVKWAVARSPAALGMAVVKSTDGKVNIDAGPPIDFPAPFGREMSKEEAYIAELDAKTGASLKLTILNSKGRVWTLVAGGGASVVYADAIAASGFADELANFTNVASTFKGVIRALREVSQQLIEHKVQIWVRRAGPNYQEGLKNIKSVGQELKLDMHVYGPEMHVSGIVPLALIPGKLESSTVKEFNG